MSKVVVSSGSGQGNIGDDAILAANINFLKDNGVDKLLIFSPKFKEATRIHGNEKIGPNLRAVFKESCSPNGNRRISKLKFRKFAAKMLFNAKRLNCGKRPILLSKREQEFLNNMKDSDAFLLVGGGTFNDHFKFRSLGYEILIAKALGKRCFLGAQTIGPINKRRSRYFLKRVLNDTVITVRDRDLSKNILEDKIKLKQGRILETVDDAFLLPGIKQDEAIKILSRENINIKRPTKNFKIIAINPRAWWKEDGQGSHLKNILTELLKYFAHKNYFILFVPMSNSNDKAFQDIHTSQELATDAGLDNYGNLGLIKGQYSASQLKGIIGLADLAIGISYHFNVFAISQGVPSIGLYQDDYYRLKLLGLYRTLDNEELAVDIRKTDFNKLIGLIEANLANREYSNKKDQELSGLCCLAAKELLNYIQNN